MSPKIFPSILILLDFASAAVWAGKGDLRKSVYWICAGILTITVTF